MPIWKSPRDDEDWWCAGSGVAQIHVRRSALTDPLWRGSWWAWIPYEGAIGPFESASVAKRVAITRARQQLRRALRSITKATR